MMAALKRFAARVRHPTTLPEWVLAGLVAVGILAALQTTAVYLLSFLMGAPLGLPPVDILQLQVAFVWLPFVVFVIGGWLRS